MSKVEQRVKQRNWVAKNDFNRAVVMTVKTRYRRKNKHHRRDDLEVDYAKETSNGAK